MAGRYAPRQHYCHSLLLAFFLLPLLAIPQPLPGRETLTRLHFFLHDRLSGRKATSVLAARPQVPVGTPLASATNPTPFGSVVVIDDPLTAGPEGEVVGSAQGLYVSAGREGLSLVMAVDFMFVAGKHRGGSFSIVTRKEVGEAEQELAVVGGRGRFRFARGYATTRMVKEGHGKAVVEYNVTLLH